MPVIAEAPLIVVGVAAGLLVGAIVNLLARAIPSAMQAEWANHAKHYRNTGVTVRPTTVMKAVDALCVECQCCLHTRRFGNFSPLMELVLHDGRCPNCEERIIPAKLAVPEMICVAFSILMLFRYGTSVASVAAIFYIGALVLLALTSVQFEVIPNIVTYPLLWVGLGLNVGDTFVTLQEAVLGVVVGYLLLWSIYWIAKLTSGREILGNGSFKATAAIGAWVGMDMVLAVCLIALLLKFVTWFPYRAEHAERWMFCPLGIQIAAAGIAVLALL